MSEGFWGFLGVLAGVVVTLAQTWFKHYLENRRTNKVDELRKKHLRAMLSRSEENLSWRKITTLSRVIGASEAKTRELLIEIEARASQISQKDGIERWGLLSRHPLPTDDITSVD